MLPGITAHIVPVTSYSALILADSPVVYLELDTALGVGATITLDSSPNAYHFSVIGHERDGPDRELTSGAPAAPGTPDGNPPLITEGTCYNFSGAAPPTLAGLVENPGIAALQLIGNMTIECWIDLDTFDTGTGALPGPLYIISQSFSTANDSLNNFLWSLTVSATGKLGTHHQFGTQSDVFTESTHSISINNTHHIVVVRDTAAKSITYYDNGVEYDTIVYSDNPTGGSATYTRIGAIFDASFSLMNGSIDEVAIYNYMLSGADVTAHYNQGTP